eukprot:TRINITY_DN1472_c0_g1_i1.p2 TRINITY_DN1472_c0_g1~~TRINITY_DN1472_c0_g1_i1.p2  ORF type:complete len:296 (-),score=37.35 TRINITY_DN1472_c0_g1_i1:937-1824(-)
MLCCYTTSISHRIQARGPFSCHNPKFLTPLQRVVRRRKPNPLVSRAYGNNQTDQEQEQAVTTTLPQNDQEVEIEGLSSQYCDDFVCESGPAVELNIRALQRDIGRGEWALQKFAFNVKYSDGIRKFSGMEGYKRNNWAKDCVENYQARVDRVQMTGMNTAVVQWIMSGKIGPVNVKVAFSDTFILNPLTGRVENHQTKWDLQQCSTPGKIAFLASRISWAIKQSSGDTQYQIDKVAEALSSMDDDDEQDLQQMGDPTRFFQSQQRQQQTDDIFVYMLGVAVLYLIYVAAKTIYFG